MSPGLHEPQREFVGIDPAIARRDIARVRRIAQELPLCFEHEPRLRNLGDDHVPVDAMQGPGHTDAGACLGRVIDDQERVFEAVASAVLATETGPPKPSDFLRMTIEERPFTACACREPRFGNIGDEGRREPAAM